MLATWISQQIVLDGVIQGFVYGLLAMSIVLVYRSTKVINFAVGNMGLVGAGLLVICDVNYGSRSGSRCSSPSSPGRPTAP